MFPARPLRFLACLLIGCFLVMLVPAAALAEDPADVLDPEVESQRISDRCAEALAQCNRQNCDLHNGYSGCAMDCVGCFGPTMGWAFAPERWEMHPSFGACVLPIIEGYVAEVESIQASYLSRTINVYQQSESERAVRDIVSEALVRCERTACETRCSDLGVGGGMQGWDCVCDPLPEPTASPSQEFEAPDPAQTEPVADENEAESREAEGGDEAQGNEGEPAAGDAGDPAASPGGQDAGSATSPEDESPPRLKSFRIRPVSSFSAGELYGYVRVTYELEELYSDGTTGRRCTLRFSGWGAMIGFAINLSFAPGYQWSEMPVRVGRMSLEDFHGVKGYHSSGGGLLGGWSGMYFGTRDDVSAKRAETAGLGWSVGP